MGKECRDHLGNVYKSITDICKFYKISQDVYHRRINAGWTLEQTLTTPLKINRKVCKDHLGNIYKSKTSMCKHYGINRNRLDERLKYGWSLKDALTIPVKNPKKSCEDHLGNVYSSIKDMCDFWNINENKYRTRIRLNWSVEEALTGNCKNINVKSKKCIEDHLGNKYSSIKNMCDFWNISRGLYKNRIKDGWSLEDALTIPKNGKKSSLTIKDHLDNIFESKAAMLQYYNVKQHTFNCRINYGWTLKKALTGVKENIEDHVGNKFSSIKNMCKFWNTNKSTYLRRIKSGYSVEEALTGNYKYIEDHLGNKYSNVKDMYKFWNINENTYRARIKLGWSIEEALTGIHKNIEDHLGNKYSSIKNMCDFWNINEGTYKSRIELGWSVEEALTKPTKKEYQDHLGNTYDSLSDMCNFWNISKELYNNRIKYGWSLKNTLTIPKYGKNIEDHIGNKFSSITKMCEFWNINRGTYKTRIGLGWTIEEALTIPKNMYIGEYRVAECLKKLNIKFYHDCQIKVIFRDFNLSVNWDEFLNKLQQHLNTAGINWSKKKIEKLRPDFVLYTDKDNKIRGVIEFDGEQHQNFVEYFFKTIEEFLYRSNSDFVKQSLWEYLNIPMLRIRHDQVDMIEEMVTDFVNQPEKYINNHNTYLSEEEYWSILTEQKAKIESAFAA